MPLIYAKAGEANTVVKVGGGQEVRAHLEDMGFVTGSTVRVINSIGGNVIVAVRDSRVAISREMAQKIIV